MEEPQSNIDFPVSVVLPASGTGQRCSSTVPKQYSKVLQRPLILFTLKAFHRFSWVKHIAVTVSQEYKDFMQELVETNNLHKVVIAPGAPARHRSIYNGLKALRTLVQLDDVVIIHDVVRLFATEEVVKEVALAAKNHGASGVIRPLVSTVVATDSDGFLETSLDRNRYRASEMPQGFVYNVILSAYEKATDLDFDYGTECLHLAMKYSNTVAKLIDGPSNLWKVTYRKDIHAAEGSLKESEINVRLISEANCDDLMGSLEENIKHRNLKLVNQIPKCSSRPDSNCVVYVYNTLDCDCIRSNTDKHINKNSHDTPLFLDTVVVHVIKSNSSWNEDYIQLTQTLQPTSQQWKKHNLLTYFLLYTTNASPDGVGKMAASIVWNRDPVMAGQIFTVNQ